MKFSLNLASGIRVDTNLGTVQGDSSGVKTFKRWFPDFNVIAWEELEEKMSGKNVTWSTSLKS